MRDRIPHEDAEVEHGKTRAVLTVSTARVRELVGRFASEPEAYDNELVYRREQ